MGFPGTGKIWMNGKFVDWRDATIHITSHVIHYGSGVFEGARCYSTPKGSACFRLNAHRCGGFTTTAKIPDGIPAQSGRLGWPPSRYDSRGRPLHAPLSYTRTVPTRSATPSTRPSWWEWGAYLGQEALEAAVDVRMVSWTRLAPNTACRRWPRALQLRQLRTNQDGSGGRRLLGHGPTT